MFNSNLVDNTIIEEGENDPDEPYGCFKSCLLNFHFFTLASWLIAEPSQETFNERNSLIMSSRVGNKQQRFERFEDSFEQT